MFSTLRLSSSLFWVISSYLLGELFPVVRHDVDDLLFVRVLHFLQLLRVLVLHCAYFIVRFVELQLALSVSVLGDADVLHELHLFVFELFVLSLLLDEALLSQVLVVDLELLVVACQSHVVYLYLVEV